MQSTIRDYLLSIYYVPGTVPGVGDASVTKKESTFSRDPSFLPLLGVQETMDVSLSELRELVMDREAWRAAIHRVTKSRTRLS